MATHSSKTNEIDDIKNAMNDIIVHLDNQLSAARAKGLIIKLLTYIAHLLRRDGGALRAALLSTEFIPLLIRRLDIISRFESLAECSLSTFEAICWSEEMGQEVIDLFVCSGGIMFALANIKQYINNNSKICYAGGQLLIISLKTLKVERNCFSHTNFNERYPINSGVHPRFDRTIQLDLRQQLVLHGVATILPRLLQFAMNPVRDVDHFAGLIHCAEYIALECSGEVISKLITVESFAVLRACIEGLYMFHSVGFASAVVLLGSIPNNNLIFSKLCEAGVWPAMLGVLSDEASYFVVPKQWIQSLLGYLKKAKGKDLIASSSSSTTSSAAPTARGRSQKQLQQQQTQPAAMASAMPTDDSNSIQTFDSVSIAHFSDGRALKLALNNLLLKLNGYKEELPNIYLSSKHSPAYRDGKQLSADAVMRVMRSEYDYEGDSTYYDRVGPDVVSVSSNSATDPGNPTNNTRKALGSDQNNNNIRGISDIVDDFNSDLYSLMSSASTSNPNLSQSQSQSIDGHLDTMNITNQLSVSESWASLSVPHRKKQLKLKPVAMRLLSAPYGLPVDTATLAKYHKAKKDLPNFIPKALGGIGIVKKKMSTMPVRETLKSARSTSRSASPSFEAFNSSAGDVDTAGQSGRGTALGGSSNTRGFEGSTLETSGVTAVTGSATFKSTHPLLQQKKPISPTVRSKTRLGIEKAKQRLRDSYDLMNSKHNNYENYVGETISQGEELPSDVIYKKQEEILDCASRNLLFSTRFAAEDLFSSADANSSGSNSLTPSYAESNDTTDRNTIGAKSFASRLQAMTEAVRSLDEAYHSLSV